MSKQKNLRYQIIQVCKDNFRENIDKHSYYAQNGRDQADIIFSYTSKINIEKVGKNFAKFMKEEYPQIKKLSDIKANHVQSYLDGKVETCKDTTLKTYGGAMRKLEKLINNTYKSANLDYSSKIVIPKSECDDDTNRGVKAQISRDDYNKILDVAKNSSCQSAYAVRLQEHLGIRVSEIATLDRDKVHFSDDGTATINITNTKGGRSMSRELDEEGSALVKEILEQNFDDNKLFSIRSSSINDYLRDTEDILQIDRHSFHDIRRTLAQEFYDELREQGYSEKEAADQTSLFLNHNKDREALLKRSYINLH
ncbi:tyrosine-type recombinase/integrase [Clostridium disporicum]|uniref:Phage integrase family protein n=1 Tax=Clostridium disporicum TaxID=84024 RepID=A0A174LY92_9CLOT|nr:tyrosine-type recombinase/integrase [Clostridium disporicum]CUP26665.1 phage integrase family protein [Clostridium disporicum]